MEGERELWLVPTSRNTRARLPSTEPTQGHKLVACYIGGAVLPPTLTRVSQPDESDRQRQVTAHHEAGHAVAACMRGGGSLTSITIEPTTEHLGQTWTKHEPWDLAFITYAGPWAEGRAAWPAQLPLDAEDHDGITLEDYVYGAWIRNPTDAADYQRALDQSAMPRDLVLATEQTWCRELETHWPAICQVAASLINGQTVTHDTVRTAIAQTCSTTPTNPTRE